MVVPIASVNMVSAGAGDGDSDERLLERETEQLNAEKRRLGSLCEALDKAAGELAGFQEEMFSSHREQIARLSVEIARKILLREIENGNYEISRIIQEALKAAPSQQDVIVRVNPDDLTGYQKQTEAEGIDALSEVKLVGDAGIGPGQCVVETDKGMVEYFIEEHLKQVSEALMGAKVDG